MPARSTNKLVEHFFRHESGKLIATLVRFFGMRNIDLVEDMVQSALAEALLAWQTKGVPDNPSAWIYRVARNKVIDALRRDRRLDEIRQQHLAHTANLETSIDFDSLFDSNQMQDSILRMIFACCHPAIAAESAISLTLRMVCGFSEDEIARSFLTQIGTIRKRVYRAKRSLVQRNIELNIPENGELLARLKTVHNVLYLMFNEGYCSAVDDEAVRIDICEEAARLCHLMTEDSHCSTHTTSALLALMLFHGSRFGARIDPEGALILLEDQDRSLWDQRLISRAMDYFRHATEAKELSSYHLEAAIAMHHCVAAKFQDTNWTAIIALYDKLIESGESPVYKLNRAIALSQKEGPQIAIPILERLREERKIPNLHLLDAALGELYRRNGESTKARELIQFAISKTNSPREKELLARRLSII